MTIKDTVAYIAPGTNPSVLPFGLYGLAGASNLRASDLTAFGGTSSVWAKEWILSNLWSASSPAAYSSSENIFNSSRGANLCYQYQDGNLTSQPLWPWPMNQRIKDALVQSGRASVDITAAVQGMFGTIPAACLAGGSTAPPSPTATPNPPSPTPTRTQTPIGASPTATPNPPSPTPTVDRTPDSEAVSPPDSDSDSETAFSYTDSDSDSETAFSYADSDYDSETAFSHPDSDSDSETAFSHTDSDYDSETAFSHTDSDSDSETAFSHTDSDSDSETAFSHTDSDSDSETAFSHTDSDSDSETGFPHPDSDRDPETGSLWRRIIVGSVLPLRRDDLSARHHRRVRRRQLLSQRHGDEWPDGGFHPAFEIRIGLRTSAGDREDLRRRPRRRLRGRLDRGSLQQGIHGRL